MRYSKAPKPGVALATQLVTIQELTAMAEFIRDFKLKYNRKKALVRRKK